eukprot:12775719-Heterocapsa_arctica.AAC.1
MSRTSGFLSCKRPYLTQLSQAELFVVIKVSVSPSTLSLSGLGQEEGCPVLGAWRSISQNVESPCPR